jgi:hypothetical protein
MAQTTASFHGVGPVYLTVGRCEYPAPGRARGRAQAIAMRHVKQPSDAAGRACRPRRLVFRGRLEARLGVETVD